MHANVRVVVVAVMVVGWPTVVMGMVAGAVMATVAEMKREVGREMKMGRGWGRGRGREMAASREVHPVRETAMGWGLARNGVETVSEQWNRCRGRGHGRGRCCGCPCC